MVGFTPVPIVFRVNIFHPSIFYGLTPHTGMYVLLARIVFAINHTLHAEETPPPRSGSHSHPEGSDRDTLNQGEYVVDDTN